MNLDASSPAPRGPVPVVLVAVSTFERQQFQVDSAFAGIPVEIHVCDRDAADDWARVLSALRPEVLVVGWAAPGLPAGYLDAADCPVRYVCFFTGSVRRLVPREFLERGGTVSNWGDAAAPAVAEHALLLLLGALRRLPAWRPFMDLSAVEQNTHPIPLDTRSLYGRTVSLHGFGLIARQLIRLMAPFDVRVRAFSEGVPADFMRAHGAEPVTSLGELFDGAEILVECEALNEHSVGSVNAALIERLAADAVFVNIGRGAVVDEAALARRAARGDLGLALDVLAVEPLPPGSPLRGVASALLSPHIGGPTRDQLPSLGQRAVNNVRRYLTGEAVQQALTLEIFDRST